MIKENQKKETKLLEHRFIELSRIAFEREIVTYSDFLNLNDQNILHTLPKDKLYSRYVLVYTNTYFRRIWHGRASDGCIYP